MFGRRATARTGQLPATARIAQVAGARKQKFVRQAPDKTKAETDPGAANLRCVEVLPTFSQTASWMTFQDAGARAAAQPFSVGAHRGQWPRRDALRILLGCSRP